LRATVERFPYGDLDCLEQQLAGPEPVAAIVMEPAHYREPAPGYLEGVRRLADRSGALLVFDEVVTALRLAPGGAQEAYGVVPDLACLGESLANGMPLSALCGPAKHLRVIARVQYGMTFRGETLSFAAAHATLDVLDRDKVHLHLAEIGRRLIDGFAERARSACVEARLTGFPARTTLAFAPSGRLSALGLLTLFLQGCLERGVLCNGNFLPSRAHGDEELAITFAAFDHSLDLVRAAAAADSFDGLARFEQRPEFFQPAIRRPC
jgi:glutamate-1-semialdehyde aminotransferase